MASQRMRRAALGLAATGSIVLAACGAPTASESGTECTPAPSGEKVTLTFSSWVPGMEKTVALWNEQNPDIQVEYNQVVGGQSGTYQSYSNQIKGGSTGDLGMIEFDALPSFRLQDGLMNIGSCPGVQEAAAGYVPWAIQQVSFGEDGAVYGIPQDVGPMAMYYRKDLFEQHGIKVPTTWDEFYEAAKQVKANGGYITNFPPDGASYFAGLAWQAGAEWFDTSSGEWAVSMTDDRTMQVADYWQRMLDEQLVDTKPGLSNVHWKALDMAEEWSIIGAAWTAKLLETNAPNTAGKWAVAPLPQWEPGQQASGNWGGSVTVVFKGSKHPAEAAKFAMWAFGHPDALALNNANGGQYPATMEGQSQLPALNQPYLYFGDQVIWKVFKEAATHVDDSWEWGPTMTQTFADLGDGLSAAVNGQGTIADALRRAQEETIEAMNSQAINVAP
jgi:multiple sugar transport system substrate-binding protein